MAEPDSSKFTCPHCGKGYRWKPEIAGRKLTCRACGAKLRAPASPGEPGELLEAPEPPPGEGDIYELDLPDDEPAASAGSVSGAGAGGAATPGKCPSCNQPMKPGAVLCLNCGFNVQAGERIKTVVGEEPAGGGAADRAQGGTAAPAGLSSAMMSLGTTSSVKDALESGEDDQGNNLWVDWVLPGVLIAIGIGVSIWTNYQQALFDAAWAASGVSTAEVLTRTAIATTVGLVIVVPFLLLAIFVAAQIGSISYGPLLPALYKITAIAVGPAAIADLCAYFIDAYVDPTGFVSIFVWITLLIVLYWIFLAVLFSLDLWETFITLSVIFIVRNLAIAILISYVSQWLG